MAELGPGPHRSGDIAQQLKREETALGPVRNNLVTKGMIGSPQHGDTAFTVPVFDEFMRRIVSGEEWGQVRAEETRTGGAVGMDDRARAGSLAGAGSLGTGVRVLER